MAEQITLSPIGHVRSRGAQEPKEIEIEPEFAEALDGIDTQEHLWILYWMHELPPEERRRLKVHPQGNRSRPKQGVFSLHSPCRPNPIGMTRVRVLGRTGTRLLVADLDAFEGSPVLDIKSG